MRRALAAAACAALLSACGGARPGAKPVPPDQAAVYQKRVFKLVKIPDPDLEASLEGMLSASYDEAIKAHAGDRPLDIGFSYSLAPHGAAYPFSEIEVSCLIQARYSRSRGPELCGEFFRRLGGRIDAALAARQ